MKLKNAVVGAKVQVKKRQNDSKCKFYDQFIGEVGTILRVDDDGDVWVQFDYSEDYGHPSQLRLVKESTND